MWLSVEQFTILHILFIDYDLKSWKIYKIDKSAKLNV